MYQDISGEAIIGSALTLGAALGAAINIAFNVWGQLQDGKTLKNLNMASFWTAAAIGALSGLLAASNVRVVGQIAISALLSGIESLAQDVANNRELNLQKVPLKGVIGALAGAVGGHGAQYSKPIEYIKSSGGVLTKLTYSKVIMENAAIKSLLKGLAKSGLIQLIFTNNEVAILLGGDDNVG